jgi:RNA polymerase sigma-70 factor (ECF subfamily)
MTTDADPRTDAELVARSLAGDREAFAALYDRYARLVRAVALDAGRDLASVQDITQETFLRVFRRLATLRDPGRFGPWVVATARMVVREQRRRRRPEPLANGVPEPPDPSADEIEDADEAAHVLGLVARLPEPERLAVHFFFLCERDADATAALLNRSRSGVYDLLKRACARLARWLGAPDREREVKP